MSMQNVRVKPDLKVCQELAAEGEYGLIPVSTEIYADAITPVEALRKLKKSADMCFCWRVRRRTNDGAGILFWDMIPCWKSPVMTGR